MEAASLIKTSMEMLVLPNSYLEFLWRLQKEGLITLKEESYANIQSEKGIRNRQIRSIQTEGHFGDIKENESFQKFHYRTSEKVYKEFMLYAILPVFS